MYIRLGVRRTGAIWVVGRVLSEISELMKFVLDNGVMQCRLMIYSEFVLINDDLGLILIPFL